MRFSRVLGILLVSFALAAQNTVRFANHEEVLAPRSSLLLGTAGYPSLSRRYVITFPSPNQCVILKAEGSDRTTALYSAVSSGGFSLNSSTSGLTVWTAEEWDSAAGDKFVAETCGLAKKE